MKNILYLFLFLIAVSSNAQELAITYFDNENKTLKSEYEIITKGGAEMYHGEFIVYFENGTIQSEGSYSLGQLHGIYTQNFDNGVIQTTCRYTNGVLNGEHKVFYESGNLKERKLYINGKIQGDYKYYDNIKGSEPIVIEKYQMGKKL